MTKQTNISEQATTGKTERTQGAKKPVEKIKEISHFGTLIEYLLKKPLSLANHLHQASKLSKINLYLLAIACFSFALYGFILGTFSMHEQLWAAPLKVSLGIIMSTCICLPSLYIFTGLSGAEISPKALFSGLLSVIALMGILLIGFAPIIWLFGQSTYSLHFMGVIIFISWTVSLCFAVTFLMKLVRVSKASSLFSIRSWTVIFLLVTLQMSTALRPILGRSEKYLTDEKLFFLQQWGSYHSNPGKAAPLESMEEPINPLE